MSAEVFLDTGGIFALLNARDQHHTAARMQFDDLVRNRRRLVTTDYILDETATLLRARGAGQLCARLFDALLDSSACQVVWTGEALFRRTRDYFLNHDDHGYSFTDCLSFVVMQRAGIQEALATDRHFRQAGFVPLLAS